MPRGLISVKSYGLKELIEEFTDLANNIQEISKKSLKSQLEIVEDKIRINWNTMVGGTPNGYVYSSVGQSTAFSKNNDSDVVGTVGVYNLDSVKATFNITNKDLNAAQIAYWVEFGFSRLKSGSRKTPGEEYSDEELIKVNAQPFISNAFYSSLDEQQRAFKDTFNNLADKTRL
ncbi:MAG: hypothetical protein GY928_01135 [Colwellia sp.]|nr:hypothetical protein [Colwellia sp.]